MSIRILIITIAIAMVSSLCIAQKQPAEEEAFREIQTHQDAFLSELGMDEQEVYKLIQSYMLVRLKDSLDLTDIQTVNLMKRIGDYKERLPRLKFYKGLLIAKLRILLKNSAPDKSVQNTLTELLDNEEKTVETLHNMITQAADDLTVAQRAKLYLFVGDFEEDIRRMAHHAQRMNQQGHQRYTKELHDHYHEMTAEDSNTFRALVNKETRGLDINNPEEKTIIELVDAWLMVRLSTELELTTEETVQLFARVGKHKDQLQQLKWQMSEARLALRIAARDEIGDDAILSQLDDMLLREEATADLVKSFVTEAQKDISTHRAAQLYIFIGDFEQEVVDLIQRSLASDSK
jgi:hypothetical protein